MTREQRDELVDALEERAQVDNLAEAAVLALRRDGPLETDDWQVIFDALDAWRLQEPVPEIAQVAHGQALTHVETGAV